MILGLRSPYRELEKKLGYRFRRHKWLERALTHRSFRFEQPDESFDNQRLEFLGDAVLGFVAAAFMFERFEDKDEGALTNLRSEITSGKALAAVAAGMGIGPFLRMGRGEEQSGGRLRQSTLADAVEAVIGAAYLDGGVAAAEKIFRHVFVPVLDGLRDDFWGDNPKGKLQDHCQRQWHKSPHYRLLRTDGPAHAAVFTTEVELGDGTRGRGTGRTKQESERNAAIDALRRTGHHHPHPHRHHR